MDPRFTALAELLVGYSTKVQKGELVILRSTVNVPDDMLFAVIRAVRKAGASVITWFDNPRVTAEALIGCQKRQLQSWGVSQHALLTAAEVVITFRAFDNAFELKGVPPDDLQLCDRIYTDLLQEELAERCRWVVTRWPTTAFSQMAGLPTTQFEDFFFNSALVDYEAMAKAVQPLVELMARTDQVRITGPGTNLRFSIKGIPVVPCVGIHNVPDGEVFTAPVRNSVEGKITYNTLSINRNGERFSGISFNFRKGRIVKATCQTGSEEKLNKYLDTDEGGRSIGEFAVGINPQITATMGEPLFDEKVWGTIHLTPGTCYDKAPNGNKSSIHWDIVCDQRKEMGGGKIYFDGGLIRHNGLFVPETLQGLNPDRLK